MLTSLDLNGDVPDAKVIVVAFDLTDEDREMLRAGAGKLAAGMRFLDVTENMFASVAHHEFRDIYPLPVLGRLLLPSFIKSANTRLLTLDSDMIINQSLRPLVELDMQDQYIAAVHDVPRRDDMNYFNSGLMLIDVDKFKHHQISERSLKWLAEQKDHPVFPDQDALNLMVGVEWFRLDRSWNWFYTGLDMEPLHLEHYKNAKVAHFAAGKPWNYFFHVGKPLYEQYRRLLDERVQQRGKLRDYADRSFIALARHVFTGKPITLEEDVLEGERADEVLRTILLSPRFVSEALIPISFGTSLALGHQQDVPSALDLLWCADRLPVQDATRTLLLQATSWRSLLMMIVGDHRFRAATGLGQIWEVLELVNRSRESMSEDVAPDTRKFDRPPATVTVLAEVRAGNG